MGKHSCELVGDTHTFEEGSAESMWGDMLHAIDGRIYMAAYWTHLFPLSIELELVYMSVPLLLIYSL